ncbi:MAG: DUF1800 domain-containing protein [Rubrivivax sp.]
MPTHPARSPQAAAVAAHRFGLGEATLATVGDDAHGWLLQQLGPADAQRGDAVLPGAGAALQAIARYQRQRTLAAARPAASAAPEGLAASFAEQLRPLVQADLRARGLTASTTRRPFAERLALFWGNHFTVSMAKASARGLVGAFEREAVRPQVGGRFETLLNAAVRHPAMLRYLDNDQSAGPQSRLVRRLQARVLDASEPAPRPGGLNENLAREILELHTLGVPGGGTAYGGWGGYTQDDVTAFARVLTGWRVRLRDFDADPLPADLPLSRFEPAWHEPGPKRLLGRVYPEGPDALGLVLADLARHPSTARFVCSKLARHLVADEPPPRLVAQMVAAWQRSDGDLPAVYRALLDAPEAWAAPPAKLKTPEEFVVSSARLLGVGDRLWARSADGGVALLGQRVQAAPSPAGWPDHEAEWLGPDAVWKRVEWAAQAGERMGRSIDARALAAASLGPRLADGTRQQIERAADGAQALALLLLAPEFQRR